MGHTACAPAARFCQVSNTSCATNQRRKAKSRSKAAHHSLAPATTAFQADVPFGSTWKLLPLRAGPATNHLQVRKGSRRFCASGGLSAARHKPQQDMTGLCDCVENLVHHKQLSLHGYSGRMQCLLSVRVPKHTCYRTLTWRCSGIVFCICNAWKTTSELRCQRDQILTPVIRPLCAQNLK